MVSPAVSVIVCTDGRLARLKRLIDALAWQAYPNFEVVVVAGPTQDGTLEYANALAASGSIKLATCPVRNLSMARNLGIDIAAGTLLAFIDDDATPTRNWLAGLASGFREGRVGAACGCVWDGEEGRVQFQKGLSDTLGQSAQLDSSGQAQLRPPVYRSVIGTNMMFRRQVLIDLGGFDERLAYYLDETDVCLKLWQSGLEIVDVDDAVVIHEPAGGHTRNDYRVTIQHFEIFHSKILFCLQHAHAAIEIRYIVQNCSEFIARHRSELRSAIAARAALPEDLAKLDADIERAWISGVRAAFSKQEQSRLDLNAKGKEFQSFPTRLPISASGTVIAALIYDVATPIADILNRRDIYRLRARFRDLHLVLQSAEGRKSGFEQGVFVHLAKPELDPVANGSRSRVLASNPMVGVSALWQKLKAISPSGEHVILKETF